MVDGIHIRLVQAVVERERKVVVVAVVRGLLGQHRANVIGVEVNGKLWDSICDRAYYWTESGDYTVRMCFHCRESRATYGAELRCSTHGLKQKLGNLCLPCQRELNSGSPTHKVNERTCGDCNGTGRITSSVKCNTCTGMGKITCTTCGGDGTTTKRNNCSHGYWNSHYRCSSHGNSVSQYH